MYFDIGAYDGGKAQEAFDFLDKDVICVEPNPYSFQKLQGRFAGKDTVKLMNAAVSSELGDVTLSVSRRHAPISSIKKEWVEESRFAGQADENNVPYTWDEEVNVQAVTIDWLTEEFGKPSFIKIDVEGAELDVVKGLTKKSNVEDGCIISMEFNEEFLQMSIDAIHHLNKLGFYEFGVIDGDGVRDRPKKWRNFADFLKVCDQAFPTPTEDFFGTVFAK
tara:strand:- start:11849 stop:12508 length:660 start_codon:yes stop_codon:yes gene_type:complete